MPTSKKGSRSKSGRTGKKRHLKVVKSGNSSKRSGRIKTGRWIAFAATQLAVAILFAEVVLRVVPMTGLLSDQQKTRIDEAFRAPASEMRTFGDTQTAIRLPSLEQADTIIVGDAMAFGNLTPASAIFSNQLAKMRSGKVANLAGNGQSPSSYNRMIEIGMKYQPKTVVYCISADDFMSAGTSGIRQLSSNRTPGSLSIDKSLIVENFSQLSWKEKAKWAAKWTATHFKTVQLLRHWKNNRNADSMVATNWNGNFMMMNEAGYSNLMLDHKNPDVKYGVEANVEYARAANEFGKNQGYRLVVVMIPSKEMVYGPLMSNRDQFYQASYEATYQDFFKQIRALRIPAVDLTEEFRKSAGEGNKLYYSYSRDMNERGHGETAKIVSNYLTILDALALDSTSSVRAEKTQRSNKKVARGTASATPSKKSNSATSKKK